MILTGLGAACAVLLLTSSWILSVTLGVLGADLFLPGLAGVKKKTGNSWRPSYACHCKKWFTPCAWASD